MMAAKQLRMKKILLFLMAGVTLGFAERAAAQTFEYTYEGQTISYTITSETDKTVSTKRGFSTSAGNYISGELILPATVQYNGADYSLTEIGDFGFNNCYLTSVSIPSSVTTIGQHAFRSCRSLSSISIPEGVTSIKGYAFSSCGRSGFLL